MDVRYKRDLNSNYMILTERGQKEENYEVRMVTENRIGGFLPCVCQKREDSTEYYYEITGKQSMNLMYERRKLNCGQLKSLLKDLEKILEAAGEYLLNPDHFLLKPEYMYLHTRTEKLFLCFDPAYEGDMREAFLDWAEYLLGKLDKSDSEGIAFGYELYQSALEPNFSLMEILRRHTEEKESEPLHMRKEPEEIQEEPSEKNGGWKDFFRKKNRRPQIEDYVAEAEQLNIGSMLFLREQPSKETAYLGEDKKEGLVLRSLNPEYPDFAVGSDTFIIGKNKEGADGCIASPTVSRLHARITFDGAVYHVEDLNSTNGTWVDQVQLNPYELCPLKNGSRILFAGAEYEAQF